MNGFNLQLDPVLLQPIIRQVVAETIAQLDGEKTSLGEKSSAKEAGVIGILRNDGTGIFLEKLKRIEAVIEEFAKQKTIKEFYSTDEVAKIL